MKKSIKFSIAAGLSLIALGSLAACGNSSSKESNSSSAKKTEIVIAADGSTKPFEYSDSQGNLTGYDIAVAKAVFKELPQYEVKFQTVDFSGITPGITSGRYQMGANDFGWSKERAQSFNFSSPISKSQNAVAVKSGSYSNFASLAGKKTIGNPSSNYSKEIEAWNQAHPDKKIDISYASDQTSINTRLNQIDTGKIDFMLYDKISLTQAVKEQGFDDLKVQSVDTTSGDPEHDGYEYFIFGQDKLGEQLKKDVDGELKKLQADGTLSKLSKEYFGGDFVPKAELFK
ncbi:transporter substrate-binding domain-containing protein [Lactococcus termiticola]|uniref:Amino acid ABC transporter substrate-binding protein n=1 Tax=Lactococcus termiticola TaxID=2169526 RepID=A0A2R5HFA5_9LACT|nr:transporter substrate-binding domain-containing protein [Lactococcus termiticola]GBG96753.1 amino acid ABC transporter substrate-binding protein [Lactococcus termiticola]